LVLWAHRMFHLDPNSRYIDVMERALYNGVMSGVSYDGETFFYANPLASYPHVNPYEHWSGIQTEEFYRRSEWFFCACCPPNLARIVANIGEYIYSGSEDTLYVNLYTQNQSQVSFGDNSVKVTQTTNYPWDENIQFTLNAEQVTEFTLALRIPDWCNNFTLSVNGSSVEAHSENGYVRLTRNWVNGDSVNLTLAMPIERIVANPRVRQDAGCIALQRGPVVYCLEQTDNGKELANVVIPHDSKLVTQIDQSLFGGISVIKGDAVRSEPSVWSNGLYQPQSRLQYEKKPFTFTAIPYCFGRTVNPERCGFGYVKASRRRYIQI
jgi:uncharacterized protein